MIQRKQSVFLLLGALALAVVFFLDGIHSGDAAATLIWYVPSIVVAGAVTVILAVVTIFLYENRQRQQRLVVAVQILDLIVIAIIVVGMLLSGSFQVWTGSVDHLLTIVLPVLAYLFFYMARRGIQADIALVRSMDRLR